MRDPLLASAGLDRLAHGATVLTITGKSYRLATTAALGVRPAATPTGATGAAGADA